MNKGLEELNNPFAISIPVVAEFLEYTYTSKQRDIIEKELKEKDELAQALSIVTCENGDLLKYKKALEIIKEIDKTSLSHFIAVNVKDQSRYEFLKEVLL